MASKSCDVCDLRHINKPSTIWCMDCDNSLCKECNEKHSISKETRNHNTLAIAESQDLPNDLIRITQYCSTHKEKLILYCQKHECPCCRQCKAEGHKECRDIENLDNVIKNVKTSNVVYEIEEALVEVAKNLHKFRKHHQENLTALVEKREQIVKEIQKTRTMINNHLDKLQEDLIKQLYAVEEKENLKIRELLSQLEKKEKEISDYQKNIVNIRQHATDLQLFLSVKQIEQDVSIKGEFINTLVTGEGMKNHSLEYNINTAIQNIITDIKRFGDIHIESKHCEIVLSRKKIKQAQVMVPTVQSTSIENIKLAINKTISNIGHNIHGCCMLPDGRNAFTYYFESAIRVFSDKGVIDFEVSCSAYDIVYNNVDNTLAVTSGGSRKHCINIIDLEKKQLKKTILLDSDIYGITLKDNQLIYSGYDKGIRMINLHDESITDIVRDKMPNECYIATFGNQIFQTNWDTNVVACYELQGKLQWTFHNESVLKQPSAVDVDSDGNVYVLGYKSRNVIVISPDGQRHKESLAASDGLNRPLSLCYNNYKEKQLLVANCDDEAHLFDFI